MSRFWPALLVAVAIAHVTAVLTFDGGTSTLVYFAGQTSAVVVAILIGVRVHRPRHRVGWFVLAGAMACHALASNLEIVYNLTGEPEFVLNAIYVGYGLEGPVLSVAVAAFAWQRSPGFHRPTLIDTGVYGTSVALVWWVYVLSSVAHEARLLDLLTPAFDVVIFAALTRLILGAGSRPTSYRLLTTALVLMLGCDAVNDVTLVGGWTVTDTWDDIPGLIAPLLLVAAALHPSMKGLAVPATTPPRPVTGLRLSLLAMATVLPSVVLFVQHLRGIHADVTVVAFACVVLFVLVVARMAGLLAEQRQQAGTDALTGVHNRTHLDSQLAAVAEHPAGTSMILLDVDHFKSINDRFGHPVGDQVLVELANRVRAACRATDTVARYGGEEFMVLLPDTPHHVTAELAERIRVTVAATPFAVAGSTELPVTVSVGTGSLDAAAGTVEELLSVTDGALYEAKRGGRNRVVLGRLPATL